LKHIAIKGDTSLDIGDVQGDMVELGKSHAEFSHLRDASVSPNGST